MTISLRLSEEDSMLIKKYAEMHNISVSELVRQSVFNRIEEEYDLKAYDNALAEYQADSITYSLDEVEKELGLR